MPAPIVEATKVSKKYGYFFALKDISIEVNAGTSIALLGPNGSGKSTLLRIIANHLRATSGQIRIFGLNPDADASKIKAKVGFVAHESFLYDELSIQENLRFYQRMFSAKKANEDLYEPVRLLGLNAWLEMPVKNLSHGLRKRADIARALIHKPELLILDEPFSGLDENSRDLLVDYLVHEQRKITLLLSSHDIDLAKKACKELVFLDRGKVVDKQGL